MAGHRIIAIVLTLQISYMFLSAHAIRLPQLHGPRGQRTLLGSNAVVYGKEPKVKISGVGEVPICSSQRVNSNWLHGNAAAMTAWRLAYEESSATSEQSVWDSCSGTISDSKVDCFGGDGMYRHTVFVTLSCYTKPRCTTNKDGSVQCVGKR